MNHYSLFQDRETYYTGEVYSYDFHGVCVEVQLLDDDFNVPDHYGELTHSWESGAIIVNPDDVPDDYRIRSHNGPGYKYPVYFVTENTIETQRAYFSKHGHSKHESYTLARANVLSELESLLQHYDGNVSQVGISAKVKIGDSVVGESAVFGFEVSNYLSNSQDYLRFNVREIVAEAIHNAIGIHGMGLDSPDELYRLHNIYSYLNKRITRLEKIRHISAWRDHKCVKCGGFGAIKQIKARYSPNNYLTDAAPISCSRCKGNEYRKLR